MNHADQASIWLASLRGAVVAIAAVAPVVFAIVIAPRSACEGVAQQERLGAAIELCREEYELTGNDHDLILQVSALAHANHVPEARREAEALLRSDVAGDAHYQLALAFILSTDPDPTGALGQEARVHLTLAYVLHAATHDTSGLVRDLLQDGYLNQLDGKFRIASDLMRSARQLAEATRDFDGVTIADMMRSDLYDLMGSRRQSQEALAQIEDRRLPACRRVELWLRRSWGSTDDDREARLGEAWTTVKRAQWAVFACPDRISLLESQIVFQEAAITMWKQPQLALGFLDAYEQGDPPGFESMLIRAYIAANAGDLRTTEDWLARLDATKAPDDDWEWELARAKGNLAELRGQSQAAERSYRAAIKLVNGMLDSSRSASGYIAEGHRGAYDDLIALLARERRWSDALAVILELDASDMLHADDEAGLGMRSDAAAPPRVAAVLEAWRGRELRIVIAPSRRKLGPDPDRAYRLIIRDGTVVGEEIGSAATLRSAVNTAFAQPWLRAVQTYLSEQIAPHEAGSSPLYVLAVGELNKLLPATLRDADGTFVIARRPVIKVQSLVARAPAPRTTAHAVIVADANQDLPEAVKEGEVVAQALRGAATLYQGSEATWMALQGAKDARLLHLAGHVAATGGGYAIPLAGREVTPQELVQARIAPWLAVLSSCESGASGEEDGWSSIAAAFLENGSALVVATGYRVYDDVALLLMQAFYRQPDALTDPARALARAQQCLLAFLSAFLDLQEVGPTVTEVDLSILRSLFAYAAMARPPVLASQN